MSTEVIKYCDHCKRGLNEVRAGKVQSKVFKEHHRCVVLSLKIHGENALLNPCSYDDMCPVCFNILKKTVIETIRTFRDSQLDTKKDGEG